jgi:hypothetical protein
MFVPHSKQDVHCKTSRLMLFREIIAVFLRMVRNAVRNNAELLNVKLSATCVLSSFRCSVNEIYALLGFTHRRMVVSCRRFGTTYWSYLKGTA